MEWNHLAIPDTINLSPFGGYFSKEVFSMRENQAFIKLVYEKQLGGDIYYEP